MYSSKLKQAPISLGSLHHNPRFTSTFTTTTSISTGLYLSHNESTVVDPAPGLRRLGRSMGTYCQRVLEK